MASTGQKTVTKHWLGCVDSISDYLHHKKNTMHVHLKIISRSEILITVNWITAIQFPEQRHSVLYHYIGTTVAHMASFPVYTRSFCSKDLHYSQHCYILLTLHTQIPISSLTHGLKIMRIMWITTFHTQFLQYLWKDTCSWKNTKK
jgi:hypothetical protein